MVGVTERPPTSADGVDEARPLSDGLLIYAAGEADEVTMRSRQMESNSLSGPSTLRSHHKRSSTESAN